MQKGFLSTALIGEERRSARLFLYLFYIISFGYDIVYNILIPMMTGAIPKLGIVGSYNGYFVNAIQLGLLPIAIYLMKRDRSHAVKYLYFYAYTALNIVTEIIFFYGHAEDYHGGNIVEIILVLFSPIFINKKYFWTVSCGTILKYTLIGIIIQYPNVVVPIILIIVFSLAAYILLNVFQGYVNTITNSYQKQLESIVKGVVATLELKDPYTRGHSERVGRYSLLLARKLGLFSEDELNAFHYSCLLHDVGKVNIPDQILTKPTRLTEDEYEIIKTHPQVGADAIKEIDGLQWSSDVIKYHHERWDGAGYPEQLKGSQIPLLARITSIADAFDAMTTHRSYRKALPPEEAFRRICEGSGQQFDPHLVDVFKEVYPAWLEHIEEYERHELGRNELLKP